MKSLKFNNVEFDTISDEDILLLKDGHVDENKIIDEKSKATIDEKLDKSYARMYKEWVTEGKLESLGVTEIPTDRDGIVNLITARAEYKNRLTRENDQITADNAKYGTSNPLITIATDEATKSIQVDGTEILNLSAEEVKILKHDLIDPDAELKRRFCYPSAHEANKAYKKMHKEWVEDGKLATLGVTEIPTDKAGIVNLITARVEYKNAAEKAAQA